MPPRSGPRGARPGKPAAAERPDRARTPSEEIGAAILYGVHPVLEALEAGRRTIERVLVAEGMRAGRLGRLLRVAREAGVPVSHMRRDLLARKAGHEAAHQGVVALAAALPYHGSEELCSRAASLPDALLVLLDGIEDPRNLGAVVRTAAAAGASGILLGVERTVGLTPVVAKTSAGVLERIPIAREPRIRDRIERLRSAGFKVIALDPRSPLRWDDLDLTGRIVVAAGGEGRGLRPGILEAADHRASIPLAAGVESLNVSVAVAIVLFEAVRQRRQRGSAGGGDTISVPGS